VFLPLDYHRMFSPMFPSLARLALHRRERAPLMGIAWSVFSSFSLEERQWD